MENNAENRERVALAVWDSLSTMDLYEMFINQAVGQYEMDPTKFLEDAEEMGLVDENDQAICVHCDESHNLDADHECKEGE